MVHNENAEWEEFGALLDTVVEDTSDAAQHSQSDASHDSQTYAQAQDELQSACSSDDDNDLEEVDVDEFAMKPQAEMEAESRTTAQHHDSTYEAFPTVPDATAAQDDPASGSSSTATTRSAEPQSEAAANRARATRRGYLARRRAARISASVQTAKDETSTKKKAASRSQHAGVGTRSAPSQGQHIAAARIPDAATALQSTPSPAAAALPPPQTGTHPSAAPGPTSVPAPSASSSTLIARPAPSSSRTATSVATLPPPPPLPVGAAGRLQLWEGTLTHGILRLKAEYCVDLPPARPASAPVVGATSAGPVPQVGARHQSAPVASTSRGKRSRDKEDHGDEVVQKRPKVNNAQSRKRAQAAAQSPSGGAHPPQWIPYAAQPTEPSRIQGSAPAAQPKSARDEQTNTRHQPAKRVPQLVQPRRAGPSTETSRVMNGAPMNRAGSAAYTMRLPPPPTLQRPLQVAPGAGPSYHSEERTGAQTYARPVLPSSSCDPSSVPRTFSRAGLSASASWETRNWTHREVHGNATVSEQRQPVMPEAGPSRRAYEQRYEDAGLQYSYEQPESAQPYTMPVPSGWNDPAAIPRTFTRAGPSASSRQMEGQSTTYRRVQDEPVAYAAHPQQQMRHPVPPMYGEGMAPVAEQLPSVDAPRGQPVYNQPYAPLPPAGWSSNVQLQAMSGGETVPAYLTMYAPPNHPPPGWNPQAPVYEEEPRARGQGARTGMDTISRWKTV